VRVGGGERIGGECGGKVRAGGGEWVVSAVMRCCWPERASGLVVDVVRARKTQERLSKTTSQVVEVG
jgi:hypothetical protein